MIGRRGLLSAGAGVAVAGAAGGWAALHEDHGPAGRIPDVDPGELVGGTFRSARRGGRQTSWSLAYPPGGSRPAAVAGVPARPAPGPPDGVRPVARARPVPRRRGRPQRSPLRDRLGRRRHVVLPPAPGRRGRRRDGARGAAAAARRPRRAHRPDRADGPVDGWLRSAPARWHPRREALRRRGGGEPRALDARHDGVLVRLPRRRGVRPVHRLRPPARPRRRPGADSTAARTTRSTTRRRRTPPASRRPSTRSLASSPARTSSATGVGWLLPSWRSSGGTSGCEGCARSVRLRQQVRMQRHCGVGGSGAVSPTSVARTDSPATGRPQPRPTAAAAPARPPLSAPAPPATPARNARPGRTRRTPSRRPPRRRRGRARSRRPGRSTRPPVAGARAR